SDGFALRVPNPDNDESRLWALLYLTLCNAQCSKFAQRSKREGLGNQLPGGDDAGTDDEHEIVRRGDEDRVVLAGRLRPGDLVEEGEIDRHANDRAVVDAQAAERHVDRVGGLVVLDLELNGHSAQGERALDYVAAIVLVAPFERAKVRLERRVEAWWRV